MFDLKSFRKKHKLTQNDIAFMLECGQPNIVSIEKYKKDLTLKQISTLKEKYDDVDEYIYKDEEEYNNSINKWEQLVNQQQETIEKLTNMLELKVNENAKLIDTISMLTSMISDKKAI